MNEPLAARNPKVKRLGLLARKPSARAEQRAYLIDGFTLVAEALAAGVALEAVFIEVDVSAEHIVGPATAAGVPVQTVEHGGLARVLDLRHPQPVVAVATLPDPGLEQAGIVDFVVVLVGVSDPGNVGTVIRSAEAAGAGAVVCTSGGADPFSPKGVRASAGAVFRLPIVSDTEVTAALTYLGGTHNRLGTSVATGISYDQVDLRGPVALVLGNESRGLEVSLGQDWHRLIDQRVHIPMAGSSESLNVAMAATVFCFEISRQRRG